MNNNNNNNNNNNINIKQATEYRVYNISKNIKEAWQQYRNGVLPFWSVFEMLYWHVSLYGFLFLSYMLMSIRFATRKPEIAVTIPIHSIDISISGLLLNLAICYSYFAIKTILMDLQQVKQGVFLKNVFILKCYSLFSACFLLIAFNVFWHADNLLWLLQLAAGNFLLWMMYAFLAWIYEDWLAYKQKEYSMRYFVIKSYIRCSYGAVFISMLCAMCDNRVFAIFKIAFVNICILILFRITNVISEQYFIEVNTR